MEVEKAIDDDHLPRLYRLVCRLDDRLDHDGHRVEVENDDDHHIHVHDRHVGHLDVVVVRHYGKRRQIDHGWVGNRLTHRVSMQHSAASLPIAQ